MPRTAPLTGTKAGVALAATSTKSRKIMGYAIAELEIAAATAENNAPIWEMEGNYAQAEYCRKRAEDHRAAIARLRSN